MAVADATYTSDGTLAGLVLWGLGERKRRAGLLGIEISAELAGLPDPEN